MFPSCVGDGGTQSLLVWVWGRLRFVSVGLPRATLAIVWEAGKRFSRGAGGLNGTDALSWMRISSAGTWHAPVVRFQRSNVIGFRCREPYGGLDPAASGVRPPGRPCQGGRTSTVPCATMKQCFSAWPQGKLDRSNRQETAPKEPKEPPALDLAPRSPSGHTQSDPAPRWGPRSRTTGSRW